MRTKADIDESDNSDRSISRSVIYFCRTGERQANENGRWPADFD